MRVAHAKSGYRIHVLQTATGDRSNLVIDLGDQWGRSQRYCLCTRGIAL
ncbi:MAG TPA: hypothetical protein V6C78_31995 [Crinalium sp.]